MTNLYESADNISRVGLVSTTSVATFDVYIETDDLGKIPHFHVRKYGKNGHYEWETCIRYDSAEYFLHGRHKDKLPDKKIAKQLDAMLRQVNPKLRNQTTFWQSCVDQWNLNNSDVELDPDIEQPDYTQLL